MALGVLFWILYLLALVAWFWGYYEAPVAGQSPWFRRGGGPIVLWVLVGLIGYRLFGPAIHN